MFINQVTFAGVLDRAPTFRTFGEGKKVIGLNVLYKKTYGGKETKCWMNVSCFGEAAKEAEKFKEGDNIVVCGSLGSYAYEKEGIKKSGIQITASSVGLLKQDIMEGNPLDQTDLGDIPF